jgi:hypothetical protein
MTRRQNAIDKSKLLDSLRLKLQRSRRYHFLSYLKEGKFDLKLVMVQRRIKRDILRIERQLDADEEARSGYSSNSSIDTCANNEGEVVPTTDVVVPVARHLLFEGGPLVKRVKGQGR